MQKYLANLQEWFASQRAHAHAHPCAYAHEPAMYTGLTLRRCDSANTCLCDAKAVLLTYRAHDSMHSHLLWQTNRQTISYVHHVNLAGGAWPPRGTHARCMWWQVGHLADRQSLIAYAIWVLPFAQKIYLKDLPHPFHFNIPSSSIFRENLGKICVGDRELGFFLWFMSHRAILSILFP